MLLSDLDSLSLSPFDEDELFDEEEDLFFLFLRCFLDLELELCDLLCFLE
jgi:hypothetical protein